MSWIFHEPLEPAVYARRTIGPPIPPATQAFGQHARVIVSLEAADAWREESEGGATRRRAFSPPAIVVAARGFPRARSVSALELWSEEAQPNQRRSYAPLRIVSVSVVPFSPVRRLQINLLASDALDEFYPAQRATRFSPGSAPITGDFGLSASFVFIDAGVATFPILAFSGTGDDPTAPEGLDADLTDALQGLGMEELAVVPGASFLGLSACKIV